MALAPFAENGVGITCPVSPGGSFNSVSNGPAPATRRLPGYVDTDGPVGSMRAMTAERR